MKSITLNRYWQGMNTPTYPPGAYDETMMDVGRMTYLVTNGHADWQPDTEDVPPVDAPNETEIAATLKETEVLQRVAEGDSTEWSGTPPDEASYKDAVMAQMKAAEDLLNGKIPDVPLGQGLESVPTDEDRAILEKTGHKTAPKNKPR